MPWMSTKRGRLLDLSSLLSSDHRPFLQYLGVRFRSIFRRRHRVVEERKTTDVSYEKSSHSAGSITALETLALHIPRAVFGAFRGVGKPLSGWWVVGGISERHAPTLGQRGLRPTLGHSTAIEPRTPGIESGIILRRKHHCRERDAHRGRGDVEGRRDPRGVGLCRR